MGKKGESRQQASKLEMPGKVGGKETSDKLRLAMDKIKNQPDFVMPPPPAKTDQYQAFIEKQAANAWSDDVTPKRENQAHVGDAFSELSDNPNPYEGMDPPLGDDLLMSGGVQPEDSHLIKSDPVTSENLERLAKSQEDPTEPQQRHESVASDYESFYEEKGRPSLGLRQSLHSYTKANAAETKVRNRGIGEDELGVIAMIMYKKISAEFGGTDDQPLGIQIGNMMTSQAAQTETEMEALRKEVALLRKDNASLRTHMQRQEKHMKELKETLFEGNQEVMDLLQTFSDDAHKLRDAVQMIDKEKLDLPSVHAVSLRGPRKVEEFLKSTPDSYPTKAVSVTTAGTQAEIKTPVLRRRPKAEPLKF